MFETPYLCNGARYTHALRYNDKWQLASSTVIGNFSSDFLKLGNIL